MSRMTEEIRIRIKACLLGAGEARNERDWIRCWSLLEDAHVLGQPWAWSHVRVHWAMLSTGWRLRDAREVRGQVLRLVVGGPASAVGRYPIGNTGRAQVPATQPMPIAAELAELLRRAGQRTD